VIKRLAIFGATGDLTSRFLMPALAHLGEADRLPKQLSILGASLHDWETAQFRHHVAEKLKEHASHTDTAARDALVECLEYRKVDVTDPQSIGAALGSNPEPLIVYLALPPSLMAETLTSLGNFGLPEESRIVIEKPFGTDLQSAQNLNRLIDKFFSEEAVFRVDHFLMMQTIQNVLGLRFANRLFELLWNRDNIERIEFIWDETVALEGRASYYDGVGALKDMIQNHLLQLLCLVGMEPPITMKARDLRDRKVDVLRAVRRLSPEEVERLTTRARYTAGTIGNRTVPAYVEEEGIDPARGTETFAEVTLYIDNWRWAGVPFVLRTGKALGKDRREIVVYFRPVPHLAFEPHRPPLNVLRFQLDPDRMALGLNINGPGDPFELEHVELAADFPPQDLPAYARLLLDVMRGDLTLSIRGDEAEECWRIVEPILEAWHSDKVPLRSYSAGATTVS
jgi:glucose-6-phosphate 1-dehydrogenase